MKAHAPEVLLLALLALSVVSCGKKVEGGPTVDGPRAPETRDSNESTPRLENLETLVDLIVAEASALPRAEFDPAALAKQLGRDPNVHFEWVRDRTWWAPYRGLLRGSQGVLLDRLGSNLDRAVLLGDLLRHSGYTVRLAHAQLPEDLAREVLGKVRPIPDQRRNVPEVKPLSRDGKRLIEAVIPGYIASEKQQAAAARRVEGEARELVLSLADQLQAATREVASESARFEAQSALAAIQDHWWIERKDGDNWIAMDVLPPDAKTGGRLAAATSLSEWETDAADPSIPTTDWHTVQVRVVVERYENGATTESTVLDTTLRAASVVDRPIRLRHLPKHWPDSLPDSETDPNALGNAAISIREWVPFLEIGDELIAQSGFSDSGDVIVDPLNSQRDVEAAGGAGFMSGFGEALGGDVTAASSLTAEWIDYEIRAPGKSTQRVRRPVFDLLGPVQRSAKTEGFDANTNDLLITRSEALLSQIDIFLQPCELTDEFVSHLLSASVVANLAAFKELTAEREPAKAHDLALRLFSSIDIWSPLLSLARWRSTLSDQPVEWFIDRPNVLNYRVSPPVVNADRETIKEMIDIGTNATGVRPDGSRKAFYVRLRQGVADTVAELIAIGGDRHRSENTASVFAMSTEANTGALIRPRDEAAIREFAWSESASANLAESVKAGYAVVALKHPVELDGQPRTAWWRIDPATGETVGVMDTGYHAALTDRQVTEIVTNPVYEYVFPGITRAALQQQANRDMRRMAQAVVPILVAKLVVGLSIYAFSE